MHEDAEEHIDKRPCGLEMIHLYLHLIIGWHINTSFSKSLWAKGTGLARTELMKMIAESRENWCSLRTVEQFWRDGASSDPERELYRSQGQLVPLTF